MSTASMTLMFLDRVAPNLNLIQIIEELESYLAMLIHQIV